MHSNLSYLNKLKPHKNRKYSKRSFSLSSLNIQSDLFVWYNCPQWPGTHWNRSRSSFHCSGTQSDCDNHSASKTHLYLKQREIYRQKLTLLPLVRKSWMNCKNSALCYLQLVYQQLKFDEIQKDFKLKHRYF